MTDTATRLGMGLVRIIGHDERDALATHLQEVVGLIAQSRVGVGIYRNEPGYWRESRELDDADERAHEAIDRLGLLIAGLRGVS